MKFKAMTALPCLEAAAVVNPFSRASNFFPWILATGLLVSAGAAQAYDLQSSPTLLGDMGGLRTSLAEHGVTLNLGYTSEAAHNYSGGKKELTRYPPGVQSG